MGRLRLRAAPQRATGFLLECGDAGTERVFDGVLAGQAPANPARTRLAHAGKEAQATDGCGPHTEGMDAVRKLRSSGSCPWLTSREGAADARRKSGPTLSHSVGASAREISESIAVRLWSKAGPSRPAVSWMPAHALCQRGDFAGARREADFAPIIRALPRRLRQAEPAPIEGNTRPDPWPRSCRGGRESGCAQPDRFSEVRARQLSDRCRGRKGRAEAG